MPPGGFAITSQRDVLVTWSDAYRTRLDIYAPQVPTYSGRWPAVLVEHGNGGSRRNASIQQRLRAFAAAGYIALGFDARGDGDTVALNPPTAPVTEEDQLRDSAESFPLADSLTGQRVDQARLGMTGISQGGRHTCYGIAFSGRPLPRPGPIVTHFPVLRAAAPEVSVFDLAEDYVPGGVLINVQPAARWFDLPATSPVRAALLSENFALLRAGLSLTPLPNFLPGMQQSAVPVLAMYSWDDAFHQVTPTVNALPTLRPGVARRLLLSTGIHGGPTNTIETALRIDMARRWFDRFQKNASNGVDLEPYCEAALVPLDPTRYQSAAAVWGHRLYSSWPPVTTALTSYLRNDGTLSSAPPTVTATGPVLRHRVGAGYDMTAFFNDGALPANVLIAGKIPLVSLAFDGPALSADVELAGQPRVAVEVDATTGDFALQAALFVVPPAGPARFVCAGTQAIRRQVPGRYTLSITLNDIATIVPAGTRVRVQIENVAYHRAPGNAYFRFLPVFADCDLTLRTSPSIPARLELPVISPQSALLAPRLASASAAAGVNQALRIEAGAGRANQVYALLLCASGIAPGFNLPPLVPLNIDAWTLLGLTVPNVPPFLGFVGVTDSVGEATATFSAPASPELSQLAGTRFSFAAVGIAGATFWATGPAQLDIVP
jgi:predicted acyl esterase